MLQNNFSNKFKLKLYTYLYFTAFTKKTKYNLFSMNDAIKFATLFEKNVILVMFVKKSSAFNLISNYFQH